MARAQVKFCDGADPPNAARKVQIRKEIEKTSFRRRDALLVWQVLEATEANYIALYARNRYQAAANMRLIEIPVMVINVDTGGNVQLFLAHQFADSMSANPRRGLSILNFSSS